MADQVRGDVEAEMDLLSQRSRSQPICIHPVRHRHSRAWHWAAAIHAVRAGCTTCRPEVSSAVSPRDPRFRRHGPRVEVPW